MRNLPILLLAALCLLAPHSFAHAEDSTEYSTPPEPLRLQGNLSFMRCQPHESGSICQRTPVASSPLEITLTDADDLNGTYGEAQLSSTVDGFKFDAIITVNKTGEGTEVKYVVQAYVISASVSEPEKSEFDFIGNTTVKSDISRLNETIWVGRPVAGPGGPLTPFVTVGR